MRRVKQLLAETAGILFLTLMMAAAVGVLVRMEASASAHAIQRADAFCAHNTWTKVKASVSPSGGYYVITLRSDDPEAGETRLCAFPGDPQADDLFAMPAGTRFAFERTQSQDFRARHLSVNYMTVSPRG